jgi:hypothetical protein
MGSKNEKLSLFNADYNRYKYKMQRKTCRIRHVNSTSNGYRAKTPIDSHKSAQKKAKSPLFSIILNYLAKSFKAA